jgi:large subunit ribosomal protein L32
MAVPKEKTSKARRNSRKANWKVATPSTMECSHCHEPKRPHVVCPHCGYYDGVEVVKKKEEKKQG